MKIIAGNSNIDLAQKIAEHCFATLVPADIKAFADGESSVEFMENVRGEDVFIVQSTSTPVNDKHTRDVLVSFSCLFHIYPIQYDKTQYGHGV